MELSLVVVETEHGGREQLLTLPTPPSQAIPAEAILGGLPVAASLSDVAAFRPNRRFVAFLHRTIKKHIDSVGPWQAAAAAQGEGWVYLIDARTKDPHGDVPPEDIIGRVEVRGGRFVPGSYVGNPNHRLLTERGPFRLDSWLAQRLREELDQLVDHPQ